MKRSWLVPALLLAAACVLFLPIALGSSFWSKDILRFVVPQKHYLRERLLHGELALWWPAVGLGRPFFGLLQPGVLYPGNVLLLLPMPLGYDLFAAAHFLVAALGMRAWVRRLGGDELEAGFAGLAFAGSGYFVSVLADNGVYVFGLAWVPAILAAQASALATRRKVGVLGLFIALCLSAGDPQAVFFAGLALVTQAIAQPRGERVRALFVVALGAVLGALIGLVLLVPGLEVASVGRPGGAPVDDAAHFPVHPSMLVELFWPGAFGSPYSGQWFASALVDEGSGAGYTPYTAGLYLGLTTPIFALAAVARRRRIDLALAVLALATLLLSLGRNTPFWEPFFRFVPMAGMFRVPAKYFALTTLCLAVLGARGLTLALAEPARAARIGRWLLGVLVVVALIAAVAGSSIATALVGRIDIDPAEAGAIVRERALIAFAVGAVAWLPLWLASSGRLTPAKLRLVLPAILAVDILLAGLPLIDWAPSSTYSAHSPLLDALPRSGPTPLRLYRPSDELFAPGSPENNRMTLLPNSGVEDGLDHLDAYDVFHTAAEETLWSTLRRRPLRLLQVTATPFALLGDAQLGAQHPGLVVRAHYPALAASIVEVEGAAPRVYLATEAHSAKDPLDAAQQLAADDFVPGKSAVIEGGEARSATGDCTLATYAPEKITLHCRATQPSYAILAEAAFPGWRASVDGRATPVLRANAAMRAVAVPTGESSVELTYRPGGFVFSAIVSGVALLVALWLGFRRKLEA